MEQDPKVLLHPSPRPHVLRLPFVCRKTLVTE